MIRSTIGDSAPVTAYDDIRRQSNSSSPGWWSELAGAVILHRRFVRAFPLDTNRCRYFPGQRRCSRQGMRPALAADRFEKEEAARKGIGSAPASGETLRQGCALAYSQDGRRTSFIARESALGKRVQGRQPPKENGGRGRTSRGSSLTPTSAARPRLPSSASRAFCGSERSRKRA